MNRIKGIIQTGILAGVIFFGIPLPHAAFSIDLGVYGQTYLIQEEDLLDFIQRKIQLMQENGEWKKLEDQFKENVKRHADRPTPVRMITRATEYRTWNYNPSITVPYDLHDAEGRVIAKMGTTINPLQYVSLHKGIIFFDGDDLEQVEKVKELDATLKGKVKLVLIRGSVSDNEKRFSKTIYFDQEGRLVNKFGIQHVPAIVFQKESTYLTIEEIKI